MSPKAKMKKNQVAHHRAAGNQTELPANEQALVSPADGEGKATKSPYGLLAVLFGIPMAVLIAAMAFRMLGGS